MSRLVCVNREKKRRCIPFEVFGSFPLILLIHDSSFSPKTNDDDDEGNRLEESNTGVTALQSILQFLRESTRIVYARTFNDRLLFRVFLVWLQMNSMQERLEKTRGRERETHTGYVFHSVS
jgi:hypothetical protein